MHFTILGIESFVSERLEEDDLCWIPFNQARELKYLEEEGDVQDTEMLERMQSRVDNIYNKYKLYPIG